MTSGIEELEWSEHALGELPFGVEPGDVEKALREKRLRRRGREKGEYEIICVSHGRFLFLVVIKKNTASKSKPYDMPQTEKKTYTEEPLAKSLLSS